MEDPTRFGVLEIDQDSKVTQFIEKPKESRAKQIISKRGYCNSGMFFLRKDSIINNFKKYNLTFTWFIKLNIRYIIKYNLKWSIRF